MRIQFVLLIFFMASCGGKLSDEQRKKLRENMEAGELRRVSDAQLTEASFAYGRQVADILKEHGNNLANTQLVDSLEQAFNVRILSLFPGDSMLLQVESQIIEAYIAGAGEVKLTDDVQRLGIDSMLYTRPVLREKPDGSVEFTRALAIHIPKKEIVLSIKDSQ